jgi:hypothetical protein
MSQLRPLQPDRFPFIATSQHLPFVVIPQTFPLLSFRSVAEESAFSTTAPSPHPKNISKVGMFLDSEKVSVSTPQPPRNSPQLHHDLPPQKHQKFSKHPVKTTSIPPPNFFPRPIAN